MRRLDRLSELEDLVRAGHGLHVRYSKGPEADAARPASVDYESGLPLPGLSVNPLDPEPWWTRPLRDWLARQLIQYAHIRDGASDDRVAWVLTGDVVGRGPDNEPLVRVREPVAILDDRIIDEAKRVYARRFDVGARSYGSGEKSA